MDRRAGDLDLQTKRIPADLCMLAAMKTMTRPRPGMTDSPVTTTRQWPDLIRSLGERFETAAGTHDQDDSFVAENYGALREARFLAAAVPEDFGGAGVPHSEMCDLLRLLGRSCGSTALACSMHQHLLAAMLWKLRRGQGGEQTVRMIAEQQPVLVSTGARDWLESNGAMERVEGGFRVTAMKHFASQSAGGDILVTSAPYENPETGARVLHFTVPFGSEGLIVSDNWKAMGMRGTGSHSVQLEQVFVPDSAVTLDRPQGEFHPFWNVILTAAMPMIMGVYVGIAQKAAEIAIHAAGRQDHPKPYLPSLVGALHNELTTAELNWRDMVRIANDLDFEPADRNGHEILTRKTNVATACIGVVGKAMEIVGGQGFYRSFGLERLFRDVQAAHYHPLQEQDQLAFCGEFILRDSCDRSDLLRSSP